MKGNDRGPLGLPVEGFAKKLFHGARVDLFSIQIWESTGVASLGMLKNDSFFFRRKRRNGWIIVLVMIILLIVVDDGLISLVKSLDKKFPDVRN